MARRVNGVAIREMRQLLGISQAELARRIGVKPPALCQVERGTRGMKPQTLRAVADTLGVPLASISYPVPEPEGVAS